MLARLLHVMCNQLVRHLFQGDLADPAQPLLGPARVPQQSLHLSRAEVTKIEARSVERAGAALDAVQDLALLEQELSQARAVLTIDAGNPSNFCRSHQHTTYKPRIF
jgi:hypothetical protein